MKRQYYRKNNEGTPVFQRYWGLGIGGAVATFGLGLLSKTLIQQQTPQFAIIGTGLFRLAAVVAGVLFIIGIGLLIVELFEKPVAQIQLPPMDRKASTLARRIRHCFTKDLLCNTLKFAPKGRHGFALPHLEVFIDKDYLTGYILIENLGVYDRMDKAKIEGIISGVLSGKNISGLEVVRSELLHGGIWYRCDIENVAGTPRLEIDNNLEQFTSPNAHDIKLAADLVWRSRQFPHLMIVARTGAGKSSLVGAYITPIAKLQGWQVSYNSAKRDNYVDKYNGAFLPEDIVTEAENYVQLMHERLEIIADEHQKDYADVGLNDVLLIFDELGNLNAQLSDDKKLKDRWNSALKALSMTGRSAGIHLVLIGQFGTIDGLVPTSVRAQCSDNVLMLGSAAASATDRQYALSGYPDLPVRHYGIGEGLAKFTGSGRKWEEPHYYRAPWFIGQ
ncbi:cell division protein FtsK [Weissella viridescens]|uniref:cell division protein FtsK n=1 Tax=Weissella viridescens TaxID=1629 RepID=UPI003AF2D97D